MSVIIKGMKMPKSCDSCDLIQFDDEGFETLNEAIEYAKQCQSNGYVIIDIQIRDFEVSE